MRFEAKRSVPGARETIETDGPAWKAGSYVVGTLNGVTTPFFSFFFSWVLRSLSRLNYRKAG